MVRRILWLAAAVAACACDGRVDWRRGDADERPARIEPVVARDPAGPAIEYTLRFDDRATHYIDVAMSAPTEGADTVDLMMATWTPGSYLIREYSRHVEDLRAAGPDGSPLPVDKRAKNRWRVACAGVDRIGVRYRVYANEMTVRTNFVDGDIAVVNGAPTFITVADRLDRPHDVTLELPADWSDAVTALPPHPAGGARRFRAADYDALVDAPIVLGNPAVRSLDTGLAVPHALANFGERNVWDGPRSAADLARLVAEQAEFWGVVPYDRYTFINVIGEGRGGLEHKQSTLMMANRWMTRSRSDYLRWLGLASHEFFHTWNVKRLRPAELGPFDYESERYTRSLWIAEGLTSYYDDLLVARAGLMTRDEYLAALSRQIEAVQTRPGRAVQPLSEASFDAWIKYYRPDENSPNTTVSYYEKGAVVGFLLDAEIRRRTAGRRSLDDVLRAAYARFSGARGYTPDEFRAVAEQVAGGSLADFYRKYVDGTEELDYAPALAYFGLEWTPADPAPAKEVPAWLGAEVSSGPRITIARVLRGTPAWNAGLSAGDEVIAIDDYRVRDLDDRLRRYRPGDEVTVLVARRGVLVRVPVTLGQRPRASWKLRVAKRASAAQRARLRDWLRD
ncbi:MAG: M61 family peptidase [Deltaproteobacteria bacterium]|nr:MAG: M61 family peptidase [Deltaproteobacteria bacterium]